MLRVYFECHLRSWVNGYKYIYRHQIEPNVPCIYYFFRSFDNNKTQINCIVLKIMNTA